MPHLWRRAMISRTRMALSSALRDRLPFAIIPSSGGRGKARLHLRRKRRIGDPGRSFARVGVKPVAHDRFGLIIAHTLIADALRPLRGRLRIRGRNLAGVSTDGAV